MAAPNEWKQPQSYSKFLQSMQSTEKKCLISSFLSVFLPLFILRLLVQAIDNVEQTVGGNDVAEGFRSALCINGATDIGEVA